MPVHSKMSAFQRRGTTVPVSAALALSAASMTFVAPQVAWVPFLGGGTVPVNWWHVGCGPPPPGMPVVKIYEDLAVGMILIWKMFHVLLVTGIWEEEGGSYRHTPQIWWQKLARWIPWVVKKVAKKQHCTYYWMFFWFIIWMVNNEMNYIYMYIQLIRRISEPINRYWPEGICGWSMNSLADGMNICLTLSRWLLLYIIYPQDGWIHPIQMIPDGFFVIRCPGRLSFLLLFGGDNLGKMPPNPGDNRGRKKKHHYF